MMWPSALLCLCKLLWKWTKLLYGLWWANAFKVKLLPNCLFSAGNLSDQSKSWRNASTGRQITSVDFSAPQTHDFKEQPWSNYRKARSRSANIFSGGCQLRPPPLGSTCWDFCWHTLALLCLCFAGTVWVSWVLCGTNLWHQGCPHQSLLVSALLQLEGTFWYLNWIPFILVISLLNLCICYCATPKTF